MSLPSNLDFATEVKTDRLSVLYRLTFFTGLVMLLAGLVFSLTGRQGNSPLTLVLVTGSLMLGCALTHFTIKRDFTLAAWLYSLGGVLAIAVLMGQPNDIAREIAPFALPLVVFMIGLLLPPVHTFVIGFIGTLVVLFVPLVSLGAFHFGVHSFVALVLSFVAALLAAQVTGELYQITEWALLNYRKQRQTNDELFDKREALQKSLKRAEVLSDTLRDANEQLESAKRSAEDAKEFRGKFLANMSHELRTPLNAIIGFSETMLQFPIMYDDVPLPPAYERDLSQIYASGRQLLHVINDILDLAKVDAGKLETHLTEVDVMPIINAVLSTAKGLLGQKPVRLDKDTPDVLPPVFVDETRFRQVLLNLYSNAVKYTDEGFIKLSTEIKGDELIVHVTDTGLGIDPEYHDKLFQEFQQARAGGRDARAGSGLGLAISKQLLDLMGGRIWMTSEVGKGSTFSFAVKLFKGQEDEARTASETLMPAQVASQG